MQAAKLQLAGQLSERLSAPQQQDLLANHALLLQATGQRETSAAMLSALQARHAPPARAPTAAASTAPALQAWGLGSRQPALAPDAAHGPQAGMAPGLHVT